MKDAKKRWSIISGQIEYFCLPVGRLLDHPACSWVFGNENFADSLHLCQRPATTEARAKCLWDDRFYHTEQPAMRFSGTRRTNVMGVISKEFLFQVV